MPGIYDPLITIQWALKQLAIYESRDIIEILFLTLVIHRIQYWLKKDFSNVLHYFQCYIFLLFCSYFFNLQILYPLLLISSPLIAMIMVLIHQKKIQQHYVSVKKKISTTSPADWVQELLQAVLIAKNKNIHCLCVIERNDTLENFLKIPCQFDARLSRYLLVSLIESPHYSPEKFIWCTANGRITSINTSWKDHSHEFWFSSSIQKEQQWKQDAIFYTTQFDCIVFKINEINHSFDVVIQGAIAENLSSTQVAHLLYVSCNIPLQKRATITDFKEQNEIIFKKNIQNEQLL